MRLKTLFDYMDRDGSKTVSSKEFEKVMARAINQGEIDTMFKHLDKDSSQTVDYEEMAREFALVTCYFMIKEWKSTI